MSDERTSTIGDLFRDAVRALCQDESPCMGVSSRGPN